jgi:Flp pilus assembly protein TadG
VTTRGRCRSPDDDRGAVTVEAAVVVFGLLLVLVLGSATVAAVIGQLNCVDAAREAARVVARGEPERVGPLVQAIAPAGAGVAVHAEGDTVRVEVTADPVGGLLPGVHLRARAFAVLEQGVVDG